MNKIKKISILYPSGNINAVVYDKISRNLQPVVAKKVIKAYNKDKPSNKQVEQVCFKEKPKNPKAIARLQLSGGEFSGNSALCLGFLTLNKGLKRGLVEISGVKELLELSASTNGLIKSRMPNINTKSFDLSQNGYSMIRLEGITHVIVNNFYDNNEVFQRKKAMGIISNNNLKNEPATGIMFIKTINNKIKIKPYVYFKKDTKYDLFKETACGSGTTAVGINEFMIKKSNIRNLEVIQPTNNSLFISVVNKGRFLEPWLKGKVKMIYQGSLNLE